MRTFPTTCKVLEPGTPHERAIPGAADTGPAASTNVTPAAIGSHLARLGFIGRVYFAGAPIA
jgi:hypothetical protein